MLSEFNCELLRRKVKNETFRDKAIQEELLKTLDSKINKDELLNLEKKIDDISVDC